MGRPSGSGAGPRHVELGAWQHLERCPRRIVDDDAIVGGGDDHHVVEPCRPDGDQRDDWAPRIDMLADPGQAPWPVAFYRE
jgi:hypothetical protein